MSQSAPQMGLVLQGGGARGAYQVGVLKALAELHSGDGNPFPIISGTSVGAINAASLASNAENYGAATAKLETLWRGLTTGSIFDPRWKSVRATLWRMIRTFGFGGKTNRYGWLDNRPLRSLLEREFDRDKVDQALESGALEGFCITTSCYSCGIAATYFESSTGVEPWVRHRREGKREPIRVDHLLASAALPLIFPAVNIDNTWQGDGSMRLTAPLSPVIRMGANRLVVIGVRDAQIGMVGPNNAPSYPSSGEMGGMVLDVLFNDNLEADIERVHRINRLVNKLSPEERKTEKLHEVKLLSLQPSQDLRTIAAQYEHEMPKAIRSILGMIGGRGSDGRLPSYLLFEPGYISALIDLGYADTLARREEVVAFMSAQ